MKFFYIILLTFSSISTGVWAKDCFGTEYGYDPHSSSRRYAIVHSIDGYANLRGKESSNSKIIKRLKNGTLLNIRNFDEDKKTWCFDDRLNGYIHVSQLKDIEEFKSIPVFRKEKFFRELKGDNIQITIKSKNFDIKKHKVIKNKDGETYTIDGILSYYSPSYEYNYVKIQFKNEPAFFLPNAALTGLFPLSNSAPQINAYYDKSSDMLFIYGNISDASVVAEFVWVVKNKKYVERAIDIK